LHTAFAVWFCMRLGDSVCHAVMWGVAQRRRDPIGRKNNFNVEEICRNSSALGRHLHRERCLGEGHCVRTGSSLQTGRRQHGPDQDPQGMHCSQRQVGEGRGEPRDSASTQRVGVACAREISAAQHRACNRRRRVALVGRSAHDPVEDCLPIARADGR
jgi:hypothetical protein